VRAPSCARNTKNTSNPLLPPFQLPLVSYLKARFRPHDAPRHPQGAAGAAVVAVDVALSAGFDASSSSGTSLLLSNVDAAARSRRLTLHKDEEWRAAKAMQLS
jgi:hypothetical protein